jgi:hypothetical protein
MKTLTCLLAALLSFGVAHAELTTSSSCVKGTGHVTGVPFEGAAVGGETIATAVPILALPFADSGNTCGFINDYDEFCPYSGSTSPDVVYSYSPGYDGFICPSLCSSSYDTKLYVYQDTYTPGSPYACNDDYCSGPNYPYEYLSYLEMSVYAGHTYYFIVDGYGGDCGEYVFDIVMGCGVVPVECPPGAQLEGEEDCYNNYEDHFNGGCNSVPEVFSWIQSAGPPGDRITICGTSGTYDYFGSSYRDTDWYEIQVIEENDLTFCAVAEFPLLIFFIDGNYGCAGLQVISYSTADPYMEACLEGTFDPGTYWLWVGPSIFTGVECGSDYVMTLDGFTGGIISPAQATTWGSLKELFK